jgi:PAS domain-containing protein
MVVEVTKVPVFDSQENKEGRKGMLVVARDITEQKRFERILGLAAKAFKHIQDAVMITDEKACIQSVNDSFTRVSGYQVEEVIGKDRQKKAPGRCFFVLFIQIEDRPSEFHC